MCDALGKNLLPSTWFTEDFEGESFASLLGIFRCIRLTGEESSTSLLRTLWGRIFCFLSRDLLDVLECIGEESSTSSMGMMLDMLELEGESSASSIGMMFDKFDPA
nr:hypothetical protein CFP56_33893 [Quercus suber]